MSNQAMVKEYQEWLNSKGVVKVATDGSFGRMTTAATLLTFANKNVSKISQAEIEEISSKILLQKNPWRVQAVAFVESSGSGWQKDGLPKILYERHYFYRLTKGQFGTSEFSNASAGGYTLDADKDGINDSWEKMCMGAKFDIMAAFQSVSVSMFQVMVDHHEKLGYKRPWDMIWEISQSEKAHYELMARWIVLNGKIMALSKIDGNPENCRDFAKFWNGSGYAEKGYHVKIAEAFKRFQQIGK